MGREGRLGRGARRLEVRRLGLVPYDEGLAMQRELVEARRANRVEDLLLLLEHPHVLTIGARATHSRAHILAAPEELTARGIQVSEAGRGGDVTYHGPGQVVGYPILDLRPDRCDVHRYVRDLEEVLIRVAASFGVDATRVAGLTGAWVGTDKVAAIGVRVSRWITSHGFAINVATDLRFFETIIPCGIRDRGVTSLESTLGRPVSIAAVEAAVVEHFCAVFDRHPCLDRDPPG